MRTVRGKKAEIVFLDASTVNLGDMDTSPFERHGRYRPYPLTSPTDLLSRARKATIIIINKVILGSKELAALPQLRLICIAATGVNNIDLAAAKSRQIAVTNVAAYSTQTVAEHTLMFMLAFSHRLREHHEASMAGSWSRSPSFALLDFPFSDLAGQTLGIIGYGTIGRQVAKLAKGFRMNVILAKLPERSYRKSANRFSLTQVLKKSDFISLHCPLTDQTHHLIDREKLSLMKKSAYLLNLARGPIVNETHIVSALRRGQIAGYATDVMVEEPPSAKHPFLQKDIRDKVLLTPHIAWASRESRQRLVNEIAKNIGAFLQGRRRNRVI